VQVCAQCGRENPDDARFCSGCGTALAEPEAPRGEVRKTVTVLFADVTGSTALGERIDPESTRKVMARYFETARAALERHGGSVEKFIGDAVMGVFGIPTVHEDDALRAVRAASELREALAALNDELERDYGVRLEIRTGLNTGEVVTGGGETLATGDAVNVAARLEQAAGPGEILIGGATERLVRDAIEAEAVEPLALKGKSERVASFRLRAVIAGAEPFARRLDSPLVGREREQRLLEQAFERAVAERACHLFTILGPAGIGKSRLAYEFVSGRGERAIVVRGRCLPYGEGITYWPLLEIMRELGSEGRIVQLLEGEPDARVIVNRVSSAVGIADAAGSSEETFWAVRKLFEALARERPLVVVVDDLQWAEPTFVDLVEHVADWSREAPILLLCLARPELLDERSSWAGGKLNATSILLEPLSDDETESLIDNLLSRLTTELRERVTKAAEGNPLFVEQMVAMVAEDGQLEREITVPPTIQALLAARLDRLEADERATLERSAVIGKEFWQRAVAELTPTGADVGPTLQRLVRKELIRPVRAVLLEGETFRFRHQLIRDATYAAMSKESRAELHASFADWLERERSSYDEIVGYHLEQAYRYRQELGPIGDQERKLADRAATLLASAGHRAFARADGGAVNLLSRAESLYAPDDPRRHAILPDLGASLLDTGDFAAATRALTEAAEIGARTGDPRLEWRARLERVEVTGLTDPSAAQAELLESVEREIDELSRLGDDALLARGWRVIGQLRFFGGQAAHAEAALNRALEHAEAAGALREIAEAIHWLGAVRIFGPIHVDEGIRRFEEDLRRSSPGRREFDALRGLAVLHAMRGDFETAREMASRLQTLAEDLGADLRLAALAFWTAPVELLSGDPAAAERELRKSVDALQRLGETGYLSTLSAELAEALYAQGRYEEAEHYTRVSEDVSAPDDRASQSHWRSVRAKIFARRGEFLEAEALAREGLAVMAGTDYVDYRAALLVDLAEVLRLAGKANEAAPLLRDSIELCEARGNLVRERQARALLAELAAEELAQRD
jgi:class 3 adenylate cyclase/tetratricopeptide (TPR) repeat protein/thymidine kinase